MHTRLSSQMIGMGGGFLAAILVPSEGLACACGCDVFDVGTSSMFPTGQGGMAFLEYDYQDQYRNWSGTSPAPAANNDDKDIQPQFFTFGLQYMFNTSWGVQIGVHYDFRHLRTTDDAGAVVTRNWSQLGDVRVRGIYTGFVPDMSAGVTLGLKLPTGDYSYDSSVVDRDSQLGTGSTDILLGGFYYHHLDANYRWTWFAQAELDVPVLTQDQYRPGLELDAAAGIYYNGLSIGRVRISPVAQVVFSERTSDSGANAANPVASGFQRILLSAGIDIHIHPVDIYADAELPVYQGFTGNQLAAPVLFKVILSYMF